MRYLYSPSKNGFFDKETGYSNLPDDCIEVSEEEHTELFSKKEENKNTKICADNSGHPVRVPIYTEEEKENHEKQKTIYKNFLKDENIEDEILDNIIDYILSDKNSKNEIINKLRKLKERRDKINKEIKAAWGK